MRSFDHRDTAAHGNAISPSGDPKTRAPRIESSICVPSPLRADPKTS